MEGVEFEEENKIYTMTRSINKKPSFADFLVKKGIAKDTKQANVMLLIFAFILSIITTILFINGNKSITDRVVYDLPQEVIVNLPQKVQETIYKNSK